MPTEKELLQKPLESILIEKGIPYIHIPNSAFRKNLRSPKHLEDFPDIMFPWDSRIYIIELGIKDGNTIRNLARKKRQHEKAMEWKSFLGFNCSTFQVFERIELENILKDIGLLKIVESLS